jgi:hypothetical protein
MDRSDSKYPLAPALSEERIRVSGRVDWRRRILHGVASQDWRRDLWRAGRLRTSCFGRCASRVRRLTLAAI